MVTGQQTFGCKTVKIREWGHSMMAQKSKNSGQEMLPYLAGLYREGGLKQEIPNAIGSLH